MSDWKPKFKAGDIVSAKNSRWHFRVPEEYVRGEGQFAAERVVDPNDAPLFTQVYFDTTMVLAHAAPEQAEKEPSPTQPNYYRFDAKGVSLDIIDVIQGLGLGCEAGNVYKYLARAGKKDASKHIEDLEKAREWLDRLIEFRRRA